MPDSPRQRPKPIDWQIEAEGLSRRVGGELMLYGSSCVIVVGEVRLAYMPHEFDGKDETLELMAEQFAGKLKTRSKL